MTVLKTEEGGTEVKGLPGLHSKCQARQGSLVSPCPNTKREMSVKLCLGGSAID